LESRLLDARRCDLRTIMDFELDHLFICVSEGGVPEADQLARLGLVEGEPNTHAGQGTACRRFFLANAYMELFWVRDPAEAQAEPARLLQLWERWSGRLTEACPFGVCVRPTRPGVSELPFAVFPYRPSYLPELLCLYVGVDSCSTEGPLLLYLPFGRRPDSRPETSRQAMQHPIGFREITRVLVHGPHAPSPVAQEACKQAEGFAFQTGDEHLLEIGFDGEREYLGADLRPLLPLLFRW
jgi:hypothetical protein